MKGKSKMKYLLSVSLVFISLFLCSCAGSSNVVSVVTSPDYKNLELKDVKILTCINPNNIILENKLFVKDLGEGDPDEVYLSFFQTVFSNTVKKYSFNNKVAFEKSTIDSMYEIRNLNPTDKISQMIHVPRIGYDYHKDSIQFIIVIDSLRAFKGSSFGFMPGVWLYSQDIFSHECKFFIWDNTRHEVVSYGLIAGREPIAFLFPTKNDWNNSLIKMTREIMRTTPFYRWKGE